MQRIPLNQQSNSNHVTSDHQRHTSNLNELLQLSGSTCSSVRPPGMPEQMQQCIKVNTVQNSSSKPQKMCLMLQQQPPLQTIRGSGHSIHGKNTPVLYPSQTNKAQPSHQFVLVPAQSTQMSPMQSQQTIRPQLIQTNQPSINQTLSGQIQLGQTYQFDVKRSDQISNPGSIILKQNSNLKTNQGQRIPIAANDKGKFIPFTQLIHQPSISTSSRQIVGTPKKNVSNISVPQSLGHFNPGPTGINIVHPNIPIRSVSIPCFQSSINTTNVDAIKSREIKIEPQVPFQPNKTTMETERDLFDWDEYLKLSNSKAAPHSTFKHVEISLHNGFNPGMKLEVANKTDPNTYWVATLISTCGSLLLLRYDGCGDDRKTDFWADVCTADLHPIGWCAQNGKILQPPESLKNMHENWAEFLVSNLIGARTAPERLLKGPFKGKTVIEMIEPHMVLEVQDSQHPQHVWMVDVIRNVGGRLLLRYKGLSDTDSKHDFWLFYLDIRLHPVGWGKEHCLTMKPPDTIRSKYASKEQWAYVLSDSLKWVTEQHLVPNCVFQDQVKLKPHAMKQSYKLSVLDPIDPTKIRPATVVKVVNDFFFLAEHDDLSSHAAGCAFLCHSGSSAIFSVDWCKTHNISMTFPKGYNVSVFDWDEYLRLMCCKAAPESCFTYASEKHDFEPGMKLEACSPYNLNQICVATIMNVYENVLRLQLTATLPGTNTKKLIDCFVHSSSQDIFPVGWCHSNNFPLSTPTNWRQKPFIQSPFGSAFSSKKVAIVQPEIQTKKTSHSPPPDQSLRHVINPSANSKLWCPVVCFNCTCKSGIFINDHDLSKVPRFVGPGNTVLVLKEVLTLIVGAAERPHKLLKDLEDFTAGRWDQPCIVKTKFDGKKYQATLQTVSMASQVSEYFGSLSRFLKCCPNLLTLSEPITNCPLHCMAGKTVGRPLLSRGRGRKFLVGRMKTNVSQGVRQHAKKEFRANVRTRGSRIMQFRSFPTNSRGRMRGINGYLSHASNSLNRSVACLPIRQARNFDVQKVLRIRREALKLEKLNMRSNPLHWSVEDVVDFFKSTDCAKSANLFSYHQVDGQAMLLLTLPVIQECFELKLGPALKIARNVERVKMAFYEGFAGR